VYLVGLHYTTTKSTRWCQLPSSWVELARHMVLVGAVITILGLGLSQWIRMFIIYAVTRHTGTQASEIHNGCFRLLIFKSRKHEEGKRLSVFPVERTTLWTPSHAPPAYIPSRNDFKPSETFHGKPEIVAVYTGRKRRSAYHLTGRPWTA
jgi:hypothetical protein